MLQSPASAEKDSKFASGKDAWEAICTTLSGIRPAFESPRLSHEDTTQHTHYQQFMRRNRGRNTDVLNDIFSWHSTTEVRGLEVQP